MTSKERVKLAFEHKEADRVPIGDVAIHPPASSKILGREAMTGYSGLVARKQIKMILEGKRDEFIERYAVDTLELHRKLDLDLISVEICPPKKNNIVYENLAEKSWSIVNSVAGTWSKYVFEEEADIILEVESNIKDDGINAVVKYLDYIENSGYAIDKSCFDIVDFIIKEAGKERFIITKSPNLFPSGMSWFPLFLEMLYLEPEITQRLFDVYLQKALAVIKQYIQMGTDCILICGDWAYNSGPFVSPEMIRKYFVPQIRAIADLCHKNNVYVMKHTDGNIMKIADDFFTMGIDAYNSVQPDAGMSLALVKQLYGDKITFMGNVDCGRTLQFGSREKIVEETKQCIRNGAHGGGFILSSDNSIYSGIPAENFITMIETARKYGDYPIKV